MVDRIANDLRAMASLAGANLKGPVRLSEVSAHAYVAGDVKIELSPATTVRTLIFPINLCELYISLENPEGFLEALRTLAQP